MTKEQIEEIKQFYKDLDCKYIVLKVEDLAESLSEYQYNQLQNILEQYNSYRETKKKKINKYFVVNRDDYPQFKSAEEFYQFLNEKTKEN